MVTINFNDLKELDYGYTEAMNTLRTNLQFSGDDIKSVMITSTAPNDGKSSICFELARSMASSGMNVILVDMDIRNSVMVSRYQVAAPGGKIMGMSHYLSNMVGMSDVMYHTNIPNMDIIFAGKSAPNPTALIGSSRFDSLIEKLRSMYDFVIIDSPPIGAVIDAAIMAPKVDGIAIAVNYDNTTMRNLGRAVKQLEVTGGNILGTIITKVPKKSGTYGYYGGVYGEYGNYEE